MNKQQVFNYLDRCSDAYYAGTPFLDDATFDSLASLVGYAQVGAVPTSGKVKHLYQMYSLQKHYEDEGAHPLKSYTGSISTSPKLDGAAISILYVDGVLTQVATRGDGVEGQDITAKFLTTKSLIPHTIPNTGTFQITGEIVAPKHIENARNYAAGALNLKDTAEFNTRAIEFFAYGVQPCIHDSFIRDMQELKSWGFNTVFEPEIDKIYPCDGVVHRIASNKVFVEWGYTGKHPKAAYALKVRQEAVETKIIGVEWQVGKTGRVSPVAILEPVMIGDAQVSRATLNNPGFIEMLGIEIGDTVALVRGGDVIPRILHKISG
jgi:NAD-dependent DNA ligase